MKKIISILLNIILILGANTLVFAQDVNIIIDGQEKAFKTTPQIVNGEVMLPTKLITELFNYQIDWNNSQKTLNITTVVPSSNYDIEILEYKQTNDYKENPCVLVHFKFTNNSNETKSYAGSLISCKAFQKGVELDLTTLNYNNPYTQFEHRCYKQVRPGYSIEVIEIFKTSDLMNPIVFEFSEFLSKDIIKKGIYTPTTLQIFALTKTANLKQIYTKQ